MRQGCLTNPKRYHYEKANEFGNDGNPKVARTGAIASCDEFPAATRMQGGAGAQEICPPFGYTLESEPSRRVLVTDWRTTEQNWQGGIFSNLSVSNPISFTWTLTALRTVGY